MSSQPLIHQSDVFHTNTHQSSINSRPTTYVYYKIIMLTLHVLFSYVLVILFFNLDVILYEIL